VLHLCTIVKFYLYDLEKVGQIKNPGIRSCILLNLLMIKIGDDPAIVKENDLGVHRGQSFRSMSHGGYKTCPARTTTT
jgi:hypothetical protein